MSRGFYFTVTVGCSFNNCYTADGFINHNSTYTVQLMPFIVCFFEISVWHIKKLGCTQGSLRAAQRALLNCTLETQQIPYCLILCKVNLNPCSYSRPEHYHHTTLTSCSTLYFYIILTKRKIQHVAGLFHQQNQPRNFAIVNSKTHIICQYRDYDKLHKYIGEGDVTVLLMKCSANQNQQL